MVYWFLSSFVSASLQVLMEKLATLGITVYMSTSNVEGKLKRLERTLFRVQTLLHDAEENPRSDGAWQVLLRDLEELAYDADDLLDEMAIKVSELDSGNHNYKNDISELLLSIFNNGSTLNMNNIQADLDGILKEMDSLYLRDIVQGRHPRITMSNLQSTSLSTESRVFVRENDRKKMLKLLLSPVESMENDISVIPIVGMVAVGKTTLAQVMYNYIYQEPGCFQLKMWLSVTKDFNVARITRSIIEAATGETFDRFDLDLLQAKLKNLLQGVKFLLVLDDLWNEKQNEWDLLLRPLRHGSKGSTIIVTTRSHIVASMVGTSEPYQLKCLSDPDCWSMIKQTANLTFDTVPKMETLGKEIAKKCKGLPLAAKTIGSLLRVKVGEDEWNTILKSKIWDLSGIQNEFVPALRLSYHHIPSHLKQCFVYCSMFPQAYEFQKEKIVRMWMAEGFIQPQGRRKMNDIGNDYLDHLFLMSLLVKNGENYKMHDAVHDLAQYVSGDKFFRIVDNVDASKLAINRNTRHLSLHCGDFKTFEAIYKCKGLRTFLVSSEHGSSIKEVPYALFQKLGRLRVVDLSNTHIEVLTESIGNLKHLRFLDLSKTLLTVLPEATQELCSLQTLRLKNCKDLRCLPGGTKRLANLKHLELGCNSQLTSMPPGIGKLTNLQTLSEFIVGPEIDQLNQLEHMNMLRGAICIKNLEKVNDPKEAEEAKLLNKRYLDKLELQWSCTVNVHNEARVLDNLKPHESLIELTLRRYWGSRFPPWVGDPSFSKLTSICLRECTNCDSLPSLGKLCMLKSVQISGMAKLLKVDNEFSEIRVGTEYGKGLQSLERLQFSDMTILKSWDARLDNDMACLRVLTILQCEKLNNLPQLHHLKFLEELKFEDCRMLTSFSSERLSSSVQSLIITKCPLLKKSCRKDEGQEWYKIQHISYIEIDYQKIV